MNGSNDIIAYCGLACQACPIYIATRESDAGRQQEMRDVIARLCREQYGMQVRAEDVTDCDGCRTEGGRLFTGCRKCEIRACAKRRNLESCALCPDYACGKLEQFFAGDAAARERLEAMRAAR